MGSKKDKVEYRIDGEKWEEMEYDETIDPNFAMSVFKWDTTRIFSGKKAFQSEIFKTYLDRRFP
jgi:hypothetical protein